MPCSTEDLRGTGATLRPGIIFYSTDIGGRQVSHTHAGCMLQGAQRWVGILGTGARFTSISETAHMEDRLLSRNMSFFQKHNQETVTFLVVSWAAVLGAHNKCHQAPGMENTRFNKLNSGAHTRDTRNGPAYTVTAIVLFFSIKRLTFRIFKKYDCPFRLRIWIYFPRILYLFSLVWMSYIRTNLPRE